MPCQTFDGGNTWSCIAGSSVGDINNTFNLMQDGATITFAAGSYSWGSGITIPFTKGVTLQCASAPASTAPWGASTTAPCTVTLTGGDVFVFGASTPTVNNKLYRITGFTFQNTPGVRWCDLAPTTGSTLTKLRIDHNSFINFNKDSVGCIGENGPFPVVYGVIDHNLIKSTTGNNNFLAFKIFGNGNPSLQANSTRGTYNNIFFEDNTFDFALQDGSSVGTGCLDVWNYAGVVFRRNSTRNCNVRIHDDLHGGGASNWEIYDNTIAMDANATNPEGYRLIHNQGSGEMFVFRNSFVHTTSPISANAFEIDHYRSSDPTGGTGICNPEQLYSCSIPRCDGSNPGTTTVGNGAQLIDGNFSGQNGYPCWYQAGRRANGGSNSYGTLSPHYYWQNTDASNGAKVDPSIVSFSSFAPTNLWTNVHFIPNRDYYNAVSNQAQTSNISPFNGTTGMGFGTLANRPLQCNTGGIGIEAGLGGVGYWATDTSTLYRCSATGNPGTWVPHYTPYKYPHDLVGGTGPDTTPPATPTNFTVT